MIHINASDTYDDHHELLFMSFILRSLSFPEVLVYEKNA